MSEHIENGIKVLAVAVVVAAIVLSFALVSAAGTITDGLYKVSASSAAKPIAAPTAKPVVVTPKPTAQPQGELNLEGAVVLGNASAKVTIVEFSDFQCPYCRLFYVNTYAQLKQAYVDTGKAKLVFMNFPLDSIHPAARASAQATMCANKQGKFWEMHNALFDEQQKIKPDGSTVTYNATTIKAWAAKITGLDTAKFNACLDSQETDAEVQAQLENGAENGVNGTPAFIIVGPDGTRQVVSGAQPFSSFKTVIDSMLAA